MSGNDIRTPNNGMKRIAALSGHSRLCQAFGVYEKIMKKKHLKFPNRKISETFLEFSSPLLDAIGQAATKDQVEKVLQITYSVWNSMVLDTARGSEKNISILRETIKGDQMASSMIEQLISRKMELYADDLRLIGEFSITQKKGGGVFAPMHEIHQRFGEI